MRGGFERVFWRVRDGFERVVWRVRDGFERVVWRVRDGWIVVECLDLWHRDACDRTGDVMSDVDGTGTVTPYFTVDDADRLIAFLTEAFGAVLFKDVRHADGQVQHARLRIGDSVIMLNESSAAFAANVSQMHLSVDDADATHARAVGLGAVSVMAPNDRPHGARMGGIKDPCGNIWWIASPLG